MQNEIENQIRSICKRHAAAVQEGFAKVQERMASDSREHAKVYRALGIDDKTGLELDERHMEARFVYTHAGGLMEDISRVYILSTRTARAKVRVPNICGTKPKRFEIDVPPRRRTESRSSGGMPPRTGITSPRNAIGRPL